MKSIDLTNHTQKFISREDILAETGEGTREDQQKHNEEEYRTV